MSTITDKALCPCGSKQTLADCCQPFLKKKREPETAEQLLRARYTAFAVGDIDYVLDTHHTKTRNEVKRDEIAEWSKNSEWHELEIKQVEGGAAKDQQGTIIFCANYTMKGKKEEHWEQSLFEKENGQWRFLDARAAKQTPVIRTEPKIGRNDPCSCGSGKKNKKCCNK